MGELEVLRLATSSSTCYCWEWSGYSTNTLLVPDGFSSTAEVWVGWYAIVSL